MNPEYITFGAPDIGEEEIKEVEACLRSGWLGTGPRVATFEKNFATYKGTDSTLVAAVNSCTAALHISMIAADLPPGSEVITTPLTFCATVNAIIHAGLKPVLADIDPHTHNIDPAAIESAITPQTSAILPVHFAGRPCNMDRIMDIAKRHGLVVIEDCAHAIEAEYKNKKVGTFGDFGCFSFYVTKNLVTGEGGMLIGAKPEKIARAKMLALHGMSKDAWHRFGDSGFKHYQVRECGFKYNMMDIQAALGIHQLARIDERWITRQQIWEKYTAALSKLDFHLPAPIEEATRHAYHLFTIRLADDQADIERDTMLDAAHRAGIGLGVHYLSIAEHPYYQSQFGWKAEQWPNAASIGRSTVSLPLSARMTNDDTDRVISFVSNYQNKMS